MNQMHRRVQKECKEIVTSDELSDLGIVVHINDANFQRMEAEIRGPPDTAYADGRFKLDIVLPDDYPFKPPKVQFTTRVWHPNISSQTGTICLDVLKDKWTASLSLRTILLSIQTLLASPEPADPQDAVVAKQYLDDRPSYDKTAKFWTQVFAQGPGTKDEHLLQLVKQVAAKAKSEAEAISVLSCNEWNVSKAIAYIS